MALRVAEQAFRSDTGRQRTANEDSYYAKAPLFAVADGMGGAQAGEVASRIAAESFEPAVRGGESPEAYLRTIAESANERIHSLAQNDSTPLGDGDHAHRRDGRGRRGLLRARRRQPRLPVARRRAAPAHLGPLARRGAPPPGATDLRAGRGPSAALDHHPGPRPGAGGGGRHAHLQRAARRRLPALLRRADDDGQGRRDRQGARVQRRPRRCGAPARGRRQRGRRPGQHHRRRVPARGRRGGRGDRGRDPDRPVRGGGRPFDRARPLGVAPTRDGRRATRRRRARNAAAGEPRRRPSSPSRSWR